MSIRARAWITTVTLAWGCGGGAPTQPTVTVAPAFSVLGVVRDTSAGGAAIAGAHVEVADGANAGRSSDTDTDGVYRLLALTGSFHLKATKDGYDPVTIAVGQMADNASIDIGLAPLPATPIGVVTESAPTQATPVAGARVEVISGASAGLAVTSGADGAFTLSGVTGELDVRASRDGYTAATSHVRMTAGGVSRVALGLVPVPRTVTSSIGDGRTAVGTPFSVFRNVHNPGTLTINQLNFQTVRAPDIQTMTVQVYEDGRLIVEAKVFPFGFNNNTVSAEIRGGAQYEVRLLGPPVTMVTITSPN